MSTVTLVWSDPLTRKDNSPLDPNDVLSVDVFDDIGDGNGPQLIGSPAGSANSFTTGTLAVGLHTFTVVTNDTTGHKSPPSNAAQITVPATLSPPSAVTDLAATLNADEEPLPV